MLCSVQKQKKPGRILVPENFFPTATEIRIIVRITDRFVLGYENGLGRTEQKRRQNKQRLHQRLYEKTEWTNEGQLGRLEKPDYR